MTHIAYLIGAFALACCLPVSFAVAQQPVRLAPPSVAAEVEPLGTISQTPALMIARAYGFDHWGEVERIGFTFQAAKAEGRGTQRAWTWWPKEDRVRLGNDDKAREYARVDLQKPDTPKWMVEIDKQFINDTYWLLFPFQLVWSGPKVEERGDAKLPIGDGTGECIVVTYPEQGGYTPGDVYDLYLDPDTHRIRQWVFKRGGKGDGRAMTWTQDRQLGPLIVSTEHRDQSGQFRLWFTDISLKMRGEDKTLTPRPMEEAEGAGE